MNKNILVVGVCAALFLGIALFSGCGDNATCGDDTQKEEQHKHHHHKHDSTEPEGHSHSKAQKHGGQVIITENNHFEVVFDQDAIRVYGYDQKQNPINFSEKVDGKVKLRFKDKEKKASNYRFNLLRKGL